jgi:hypothetical protein
METSRHAISQQYYLCAEFHCFFVVFQFELAGSIVQVDADLECFRLLLFILTVRAVILNELRSLFRRTKTKDLCQKLNPVILFPNNRMLDRMQ